MPVTDRARRAGSIRRSGWATFLVVALFAVLLTTSAAGPAAAAEPVPGGPVILDGNDPADHVAAITTYVLDVYSNLNANLAPGYVHNGSVAVVGTCQSMLEGMGVAETFVTFDTAAAVEGLFVAIGTNNYKIIHICSNDDNTLPAEVETELDKWGSAIAAHVNRGGALFSTGHSYNWLNDLFPSLTVSAGGTSSSYVTADGDAFFASLAEDAFLNAINHFTFSNVDTTTLLPLLSQNTGGGGLIVAIGGTTVRFPQISFTGPTTGEVGTEAVFTLVAADADGNPLSSNSFTWTITGVTPDAGTGSATTDASGEYEFRFTGTSAGDTRITVQMTLGTGESAGSAITTTWATLPSAPAVTSAVDVGAASGSVRVVWDEPDDGGKAITDYVLEYRAVGAGSWTTFDDGVSTVRDVTVDGLSDTVEYEFRVAAVNPLGQGPWSTAVSGTPVGSPTAPIWSGFTAGDGQFGVTWNPPDSDNGSAVTHYVVQYSPRDAGTWTTVSPDPTGTTTTISGVPNATWYDVRVAAVNADGQGPWSNFLAATGLTVPGAVGELRVIEGDGQVRIEWASPDFDGGHPVTDFVITGPGTCVPEHWHPDGVHTAHWWRCTIDGLTNDTTNTWSVAAVNDLGTGPATEISGTAGDPSGGSVDTTPDSVVVVPNYETAECAAPTATGSPRVDSFPDVTRAYQIAPVDWARSHGLTIGIGGGLFDPNGLVPRKYMAMMLWRAFDQAEATGSHHFNDVGPFQALDWTASAGFLVGIGNGRFDPYTPATRAEWITVLWRATCRPLTSGPNPFTDLTAEWQADPVHWGVSTGVTTGTSATTFQPDRQITRGEAFVMLVRWIKSFGPTPADLIGGADLSRGDFALVAGRPSGHDAVKGTALLARHDGGTNVTVTLTGLPAMTSFMAHVHEGTCAEAGGHYRFDPAGAGAPPNEIHLMFTSTLNGTANVTVHNDGVAGPDAKSVVVHATTALSPKIACADLA